MTQKAQPSSKKEAYEEETKTPHAPVQSRPASTFAKKPVSSALVPTGRKVNIVSNQYHLHLGGSVVVFQYKLDVLGLEMWDANLVQQIMRFKRTALDTALG